MLTDAQSVLKKNKYTTYLNWQSDKHNVTFKWAWKLFIKNVHTICCSGLNYYIEHLRTVFFME